MFSLELQRRSDAYGWGLISNAAHPGYARTDLIANGPGNGVLQKINRWTLQPLMSQSATDGALPTLFAAAAPEAGPAGYYGPTGPFELKGAVGKAAIAKRALDRAVSARLWEESEGLTNIVWPGVAQ